MHNRRRHRPVHHRSPWLVRSACIGALVGVVAVGVLRTPPSVDVDDLAAAQDRRVCILLESFLAVASVGVSPPADATPEDFRATVRANAQLAQMRENLRESVREMGC